MPVTLSPQKSQCALLEAVTGFVESMLSNRDVKFVAWETWNSSYNLAFLRTPLCS